MKCLDSVKVMTVRGTSFDAVKALDGSLDTEAGPFLVAEMFPVSGSIRIII